MSCLNQLTGWQLDYEKFRITCKLYSCDRGVISKKSHNRARKTHSFSRIVFLCCFKQLLGKCFLAFEKLYIFFSLLVKEPPVKTFWELVPLTENHHRSMKTQFKSLCHHQKRVYVNLIYKCTLFFMYFCVLTWKYKKR